MKIIGTRIPRVDAQEKVNGKALYADDLQLARMVHIALVPSGIPHGVLKSIDTAQAKAMPGVVDVFTWEDVPGANQLGETIPDYPMLLKPGDRIRFPGDFIAIVAAEDRRIAQRAATAVGIEYDTLDPILDIETALEEKTLLYDSGNKPVHHKTRKGNSDPATMFDGCDCVMEGRFFADYQEQAYLETQGMVAYWDHNHNMTLHGSMQCPYYVQQTVSHVLGIPLSDVRIIQAETGGGFGGKEDVPSFFAAPAALVAYHLNRPAKLILSREEDIRMTSKRHPIQSHYKVGFSLQGKIQAVHVVCYGDMGAHATLSPVVLWRTVVHAAGAYEIPNVCVDVYGVYTNKVPCGAYRGFGSPQVFFAMESMMDEIAQSLGMDPLQIRELNALDLGKETPTGQLVTESVGARETLEHARVSSKWEELRARVDQFNRTHEHFRQGIGVAHIHYGVALGALGQWMDASGAHIQMEKDGSVGIHIGGTEIGQGARTVMAQIASECLGIPLTKIHVCQTDSAFVPDSGPTVASRTTIFSGNAVLSACQEIARRLIPIGAKHLGVSETEVLLQDGMVARRDGSRQVSIEIIASEALRMNVSLSAMGWFPTPKLTYSKEEGYGQAYITYSYATQIAVVEVDMLTAHVQVKEVYAAHDVGQAINLDGVYGQVHGGFVQGMGYALYEHLAHDAKGTLITDNFNTLTIPTIHETPEVFEVSIVEHPFSQGPFGAKGIGEPSLIPAPAAIANAVSHAVGKRVRTIPITKDDLLDLIMKND